MPRASAAGAPGGVASELLLLDLCYTRLPGRRGPSVHDYAQTRFPEAAGLLTEAVLAAGTEPSGGRAEDTITRQRAAPAPTSEVPPGTGTEPAGRAQAEGRRGSSGAAASARCASTPGRRGLGEGLCRRGHGAASRGSSQGDQTGPMPARTRAANGFVLEAERSTAIWSIRASCRLDGLGTYADGRPFYAMRFIRGDDAGGGDRRFHKQKAVRLDSLEFRKLLGRLVQVCQAIGYAYSRGSATPRDIKPKNIMLGKYGETLRGRLGSGQGGGSAREQPRRLRVRRGVLRPSGRPMAPQATVGVNVGTPAYMSPEQAAGKVDFSLGPATDIYSLGATLHALLTNPAPFKGPVAEVVKQVERGEWKPTRRGESGGAGGSAGRDLLARRWRCVPGTATARCRIWRKTWNTLAGRRSGSGLCGASWPRTGALGEEAVHGEVTAAVVLLLAGRGQPDRGHRALGAEQRERQRKPWRSTQKQVDYLVGEVE